MNIFSKKNKTPSETKPTINLVTTLALNKIYIVLSVRGKNKLIIIQTVEWLHLKSFSLHIQEYPNTMSLEVKNNFSW